MSYSERTQVLLSPTQREKVERIARRTSQSVGAVIRAAVEAYEQPDDEDRTTALEQLFALEAPVDDWPQMKEQIQRGALG